MVSGVNPPAEAKEIATKVSEDRYFCGHLENTEAQKVCERLVKSVLFGGDQGSVETRVFQQVSKTLLEGCKIGDQTHGILECFEFSKAGKKEFGNKKEKGFSEMQKEGWKVDTTATCSCIASFSKKDDTMCTGDGTCSLWVNDGQGPQDGAMADSAKHRRRRMLAHRFH
eukprot:GFYU01019117.1.p1 GENE.GFYU01019117.1~~GFYU01019117.1.p1  ORF type:complete len:183 (-),score=70.40 GFYU01019117.1:99-605(-)